jgi:hypothetical protein
MPNVALELEAFGQRGAPRKSLPIDNVWVCLKHISCMVLYMKKSQVRRQQLKIMDASCRLCNQTFPVNWSGCSAWQNKEALEV